VSFERPILLLTLLAIPLGVLLFVLLERRRMRYALRFTNLDVLASVVGRRPWRRYVPAVLLGLALSCLLVALARPHVKRLMASDRATVILVIDASGSMQARDVAPTRLGAAQEAVRTFLDRAPKRLRVGLIAFAGEPQVAAPPTTDHDLVRESVDLIGSFPGYGGTAIGDALAAAVELGQQAVEGGQRTLAALRTEEAAAATTDGLVSVLFLSDGAQTRGELGPLEGAARAKAAGIRVYTVSLGTPDGTITRGFGGFMRTIPVPPDVATMQAIARMTGGEFVAARTAGSLQSAYAKLGSSLGRTPGKSEITFIFLAGAAGLLIAAGVLAARWAPRLP
jgi:Ca-activated chloride channel family protein